MLGLAIISLILAFLTIRFGIRLFVRFCRFIASAAGSVAGTRAEETVDEGWQREGQSHGGGAGRSVEFWGTESDNTEFLGVAEELEPCDEDGWQGRVLAQVTDARREAKITKKYSEIPVNIVIGESPCDQALLQQGIFLEFAGPEDLLAGEKDPLAAYTNADMQVAIIYVGESDFFSLWVKAYDFRRGDWCCKNYQSYADAREVGLRWIARRLREQAERNERRDSHVA